MGKEKGIILVVFFLIFAFSAGAVRAQEPREVSGKMRIAPVLRYIHVSGDEEKFREDWWIGEDWAGGLEKFLLEHTFDKDVSLSLEGRAVVPEEDYRFNVDITKPDFGYLRGGHREYRKYFDGTGCFYAPFGILPFELENDLRLDIGDFFVQAGITFPGWPAVAATYERQYKEGNKSLLEWGSVSKGGTARNIFPAFKDMDEEADLFKLEANHAVGKFKLADKFRYESYRTDTARFEEERNLDGGTSETVTVREGYSHDALSNTFHVETHVSDKIYWSLGYLYTKLEGDAGFGMNTVPFGPDPFDKNWFTRSVEIEQDSHVLDLNAMLGPYKHFTFYGGFQAETTEGEGDTDAVLTETSFGGVTNSPEAMISSRTEKDGLEESVGIRYTGLPFTTAYAEGAWVQHKFDLWEQELEDGALGFERLTDTDADRERYTLGINTSPFRAVTLSLRYRRSHHANDYDHLVDTEPGYSAFITHQDYDKDDIRARFTLRPVPVLRLSLSYQLLCLDIETRSDTTPPSSVLSGDYDANIYSLAFTLTPVSRFYMTGLLSYQGAKTTSFDNAAASVLTYEGDVFAGQATVGFAIDEKTDLKIEYLYSRSDNFEDNSAEGLPLGLDHERHGFMTTFSRHLGEKTRLQFRYGYYRYDEDNTGGVDDYRGHLVGISFAFKL